MSSHEIKKALSSFYHKNIFDRKECKNECKSYIHFLSKIFFMIKWIKAFLFLCDDSLVMSKLHFSLVKLAYG